jgi:hypothetical protein
VETCENYSVSLFLLIKQGKYTKNPLALELPDFCTVTKWNTCVTQIQCRKHEIEDAFPFSNGNQEK